MREPLSTAWQACFEEAWRAYCAGSVPIGALVTDAAGQVLSRGRNRIFEDGGQVDYLSGQTLAHAEINALITLNVNQAERLGCVLYTTVEPCPLCMGAFYMSSVRELRYACREPYAGSVNLLGKTPYLSRKPVKVFGPEHPKFEIVNMSLLVEFDIFMKGESDNRLLETWEKVVPRGVWLGQQLYHSGEFRKMREVGKTAKEVLDWLREKV